MPGQTTSQISSFSFNLSRYLIFLTLLFFICSGGAVMAATRYVKPSAEIPIRSGQGTEYKILVVVPDGMKVEIVEENDPWALVRTPGGTEGWMLKRYLTDEPPLSEVVASLEAQKTNLMESEAEVRRKYDELVATYSRNEEELNTCILERDETNNRYLELQQDTADVIKIKNDLESRSQELQAARKQLSAVQEENSQLKRNSSIRWFLAGGGVLFIGILLGLLSCRSRRRKSTLY